MSSNGDEGDRDERAARNQSLFREINERIESLNEGFGPRSTSEEWICECANDTCTERVAMAIVEYEAVRQNGATFFVAPSGEHVWADVEKVIMRSDRYWIVEKFGDSGKLAEAADPRAG